MTSKLERAKALLQKAESAGCQASPEGKWVVFRPPLPMELIFDAADLGDQLAELMRQTKP